MARSQAIPNNPDAASRYTDDVVDALNDVLRGLTAHQDNGWTLSYQSAREIVSEVKRQHQVSHVAATDTTGTALRSLVTASKRAIDANSKAVADDILRRAVRLAPLDS